MHIMTARGWKPLNRPCSNQNDLQGVFVNQSLEDARKETDARASRWQKCMTKYNEGEYGGDHGWEEMWRDMRLSDPIHGAYGEKL